MVYTRFTNPTVAMFQDRLAALEGAESCVATASGMAAILATAMVHLKAGDHVVCSNAVFGATIQLFNNDPRALRRRDHLRLADRTSTTGAAPCGQNTRLFFLETPSNPLTEISDIAALAEIAKKAGALLAVDNVFCTPALQRPLELGADLVIHSATKYLDGQGRVLARRRRRRARTWSSEPLYGVPAHRGADALAVQRVGVLKGLETLELRMRAQSAAALELARWLEAHPNVSRVHLPRPRVAPAARAGEAPAAGGGAVLSFDVKGGRAGAWRVIDSTRLISMTANLGDVKTTIIHPATTTHGRISPEARAAAGISEGLVRVAVGLEALSDLKADLERGLA